MANGITINGLAITNERDNTPHTHPTRGLAEYYRQNVIGGPGAFVLVVSDFAAFGDGLANKLLAEIAAASQTPRQVVRAD